MKTVQVPTWLYRSIVAGDDDELYSAGAVLQPDEVICIACSTPDLPAFKVRVLAFDDGSGLCQVTRVA